MRKSLGIVCLTGIMVIAFVGLLVLQSSYIKMTANMREDQFNENVRMCLFSITQILEEEETMRFLADNIESELQDPDTSQITFFSDDHKKLQAIFKFSEFNANNDKSCVRIKPKVYLQTASGKNTLQGTSHLLQKKLRDRFNHERQFLDNVLLRLLGENYSRHISERIDFNHLTELLDKEMQQRGLDLPHYVAVYSSDGVEVYSSKGFNGDNVENTYSQALFVNDPYPTGNYMMVYFPTKNKYVYNTIRLVLPTTVIFFLLLLIFISSLMMISREKRLTQMRTDFMNNMTHELKTPVSSISLASQMLSDESIPKTPRMLAHLSKTISDETQRLTQQIEKVLQMSILEKESSALKLKEIDVNELILKVTSNFMIKVKDKGGDIDTTLDANYPFVLADEVHFTNIIYNLMDNALKYTEAIPHLEVNTADDETHVIITVKDNGIGIKPEDKEKIFDKFFRVSTGNVHNVKGFGLGLAYVKKVVTDHKGTITCDSIFGEGTTFTIRIPKVEEKQNKEY